MEFQPLRFVEKVCRRTSQHNSNRVILNIKRNSAICISHQIELQESKIRLRGKCGYEATKERIKDFSEETSWKTIKWKIEK